MKRLPTNRIAPARLPCVRFRRSSRAAGFTLVEVLLALALTLVLMGGIYTAFQMYNQLTTAGRNEVEQSQIVRAIQRKITEDVRSVVFPPLDDEEEQAGASTEEGALGEDELTEDELAEEVETTVIATESIAATAEGIVGDATSLVLHVSRPPREGLYDDAIDGLDVNRRLSDLISVTYLLASPEGGNLHAAVHQNVGFGLARLVGDRLTMNTLDETGSIDRLADAAEILSPEVTSLQFRYSDGSEDPANWPDNWDSITRGMLPRAIQVTVTVRPSSAYDDDENVAEKSYSFLIAVPMADPTPPGLKAELESLSP